MLVLSQGPVSARTCAPLKFSHQYQYPPLLSTAKPRFLTKKKPLSLSLAAKAKTDGGVDATSGAKQPPSANNTTPAPPPSFNNNDTVLVGQEDVPLEGVIQFEKPASSSRLVKWSRVALLAGGDVLALLLFSAIGRVNHGFPVFDFDTLRTADPFIAGWFLCAYLLGGYGDDGLAMNGLSKAVIAAAKSWALGIPLGLIIRAATSGHIPPYTFVLLTMGSTAVVLIGWRAISFRILSNDTSKKDDVYRRGSPFELFELLTSLVRRW